MSGQPSKWVRLKTESTVFQQKQTHVELMSKAVRQFFLARKEMVSTKPPARSKIRADICCTLYFPNENPLIYLPLVYLRIFFHLIANDTWKQQITALEDLLAIMCLMQTGIPWWNGVAVFFINKKMASPKRSLLTKIQLYICRILYPPDDNLWA